MKHLKRTKFSNYRISPLERDGKELLGFKKVIKSKWNGQIIGYSGIARDILKLKMLNLKMNPTQKKIELYNQTIKKHQPILVSIII
jgi:hypothetical protein